MYVRSPKPPRMALLSGFEAFCDVLFFGHSIPSRSVFPYTHRPWSRPSFPFRLAEQAATGHFLLDHAYATTFVSLGVAQGWHALREDTKAKIVKTGWTDNNMSTSTSLSNVESETSGVL